MKHVYHRYGTLYLSMSLFTIWETILQWFHGHWSLVTGYQDISGCLCPWDVALETIHSEWLWMEWPWMGHQLSKLDFSLLRGKWPFWHGCVRSLCDPSAADTQLGQVLQDRWESPWCEPTLPTSPLSIPWIPVPVLCTTRKGIVFSSEPGDLVFCLRLDWVLAAHLYRSHWLQRRAGTKQAPNTAASDWTVLLNWVAAGTLFVLLGYGMVSERPGLCAVC